MDWKVIGLKCGLEIHWELNTERKLFCSCSTRLRNDEPDVVLERYLHPVAGELGDVDVAARFEAVKNRKLIYQGYSDTTCLVETDDEPPHELNRDALEIALMISLLLNARLVDEIHVMRKTIIDGSNVSGFQRTMLVARDGFIKTFFGKVEIKNISLEEDSARIIENKDGLAIFRLDRLGVPEVEIGTEPDIHTPEQALEVAEAIGKILKSTGRVKSGLGVVRQDVNVSIQGGARTEIKHVQRLSQIPEVIKKEVERQLQLIKAGKRVENSVRVAKEDGTTEFLRPLAGAARMYVETDIFPIEVDEKLLKKIKTNLPESLEKRGKGFREKLGLSQELANQIVNSEYVVLFERIVGRINIDPTVVASTLVNTLKDLRRRNVVVENVSEGQFFELFRLLKMKKITKESLAAVLENIAKNSDLDVKMAAKQFESISEDELRKIVRKNIDENREKLKDANGAYKFLMGIVMGDVRGRIEGSVVNKVVKEEVENIFTGI